ncbi:hypothetical protein B0H67DRAFT_556486 [Lasiosphaeris hirsuta]|uniref:Uncharacterized protein n=1 Tax=Lasiosphaeris hirsuta TaxID=260670 RepID=A0AA40A226_9PEZI|nr:hypothetical protein B0H67DRAFT_556486 [Lasiosphaeris hirsuta]
MVVGNVGKSVARSYGLALDALMPNLQIMAESHPDGAKPEGYDRAMGYLTSVGEEGLAPFQICIEKQATLRVSHDNWDRARTEALNNAKIHNSSEEGQRLEYERWVEAHAPQVSRPTR